MKKKALIKVRIKQLKTLVFLKVLSFFALFQKKNCWVISERGKDARDNGWHFYKYLKTYHPEIKVYYIIDKKSADYERVKEDAVQYGSLKNYWVVAKAKRIISSHVATCVPYLVGRPWKYSGLGKKFYFLQHGVIPNRLTSLFCENAPMRLFVCGAKPEYEYIRDTYGHEENVVQYTGLARYDNLHDIKTKKQILIMPTWRRFIQTKGDLLNSKYFQEWNSLLKDERLIESLKKNGYELFFYPHYEIQKYIDCFDNNGNSFVKIADFQHYDVQTLLKESALLITDYSSVFFDFAYMRKPVLYFQFDKEEFYGQHYQEGYFNCEQMGFGEVCYNIDQVVGNLITQIENKLLVKPLYEERMKSFFPLHDNKNCERIFNAIIER